MALALGRSLAVCLDGMIDPAIRGGNVSRY